MSRYSISGIHSLPFFFKIHWKALEDTQTPAAIHSRLPFHWIFFSKSLHPFLWTPSICRCGLSNMPQNTSIRNWIFLYLGGSVIYWKTQRQATVALTTTEAEYMALGDCAKHCLWFRCMISHLSQSSVTTSSIVLPPLSVFNDNNRAIFLSQESATNSRSKQIDIQHIFICELIKTLQISNHMISTKLMPSDFLTKTHQNKC